MKIAVASDHCGYALKMKVLPELRKKHDVIDFGCDSEEPVDFPDLAQKLCQAVLENEGMRGIMFCGTGVGAAIACNKIKGIRATVCHDIYTAHQCVEHDNVQIITMGGQIIGDYIALELINAFLPAEFSTDEEFRRRVAKLDAMEEQAASL